MHEHAVSLCVYDIVDLDHLRVVKCDRHDRYARDHGMTSYFVSAKTGESVSPHHFFFHLPNLGARLLEAVYQFVVRFTRRTS